MSDIGARWRSRQGIKWSTVDSDVLPAWVADMDFDVAEPIRARLSEHSAGDLGYPVWADDARLNSLTDVFVRRLAACGVQASPGEVSYFSEIIQSWQVVLFSCTAPGDVVAMHTPCYPPFRESLRRMDRQLLPIPALRGQHRWQFDLVAFERAIVERGCRVLLLVNPHNPTGRVFDRAELRELADIAESHDLLVVSDEVHADLVHPPHEHISFAGFAPQRTVTVTSASKAFNIAGLRCCVVHVGSSWVRRNLAAYPAQLFGSISTVAALATEVAWTDGADWLKRTRELLLANRRRVEKAMGAWMPYTPQASYLAWLDGTAFAADPAEFLLTQARVKVSPGVDFDPLYRGFARLNFATDPAVLEEILRRVRAAVDMGQSGLRSSP